jgi:hypothetical protein
MILASERWYADSLSCAKATHPEADGIDCGASRTLTPQRGASPCGQRFRDLLRGLDGAADFRAISRRCSRSAHRVVTRKTIHRPQVRRRPVGMPFPSFAGRAWPTDEMRCSVEQSYFRLCLDANSAAALDANAVCIEQRVRACAVSAAALPTAGARAHRIAAWTSTVKRARGRAIRASWQRF